MTVIKLKFRKKNVELLKVATLLLLLLQTTVATAAEPSTQVSPELVATWMEELSNWGRWGPDDEMGTLNLISLNKIQQAASLIRTGTTISLSHNYAQSDGDQNRAAFGHTLIGHDSSGAFVMDRIAFSYHGAVHSHMDSLCHMSHEGKFYNNFSRTSVTDQGCQTLAITNAKNGIVTRGVLVDIARLKGVGYLSPGTPIYLADFEAWEKKTGIKIEAGDVVLVRTGRWATSPNESREAAGIHVSMVPWLRSRDIAMLGSDYANDVIPSGVDGIALPVHQLLLVAMGVRLFDNLDLELLAREADRQQRWAFFFTAAPIAIEGGTGSPINPIAVF